MGHDRKRAAHLEARPAADGGRDDLHDHDLDQQQRRVLARALEHRVDVVKTLHSRRVYVLQTHISTMTMESTPSLSKPCTAGGERKC